MRNALRAAVMLGWLGCTPLERGLPDPIVDAARSDAPSQDAPDATDSVAADRVDVVTPADAPDAASTDVPDAGARDVAADMVTDTGAPMDVRDVPVTPDVVMAMDVRDAADVASPIDAVDVVDVATVDAPDVPAAIDAVDVVDAQDVVDAPDVRDVPDVPDVPGVTDIGVCEPTSRARLVGPISGSRVTTRRPLLRWALPPAATGATVVFCRDRACAMVIDSVPATGTSLRVTRPELLASPAVFWRVRPTQNAAPCGLDSATWELWPARQDTGDGYAYRPVTDVNADGRADLAISGHNHSSGAGRAYVYLGQSDGLPSLPTQTIASPVGSSDQFGMPSAGDFNGDGITDLLVAELRPRSSYRGRAWVYLSDGARLQAPPQELVQPTGGYNYFAQRAHVGDYNGDGYADALVISGVNDSPDPMGGHVYVYYGSPSGPPSEPGTTIEGTGGMGASFAADGAVVDLEGDGYDDFLATQFSNDSRVWVVLRGGPTGLRRDGVVVSTVAGQRFPNGSPANLGDVNGDGRVDFGTVETSTGSPRLLVALGSATGTPGATGLTLTLADSPASASRMHGIDVDADGRADVVISQVVGGVGRLYVYPYRGSAFAAPTVLIPRSGDPDFSLSSIAGDYNGDGWVDLVSQNFSFMPLRGAFTLLPGTVGGGISTAAATVILGPETDSSIGFRLAGVTAGRVRGGI